MNYWPQYETNANHRARRGRELVDTLQRDANAAAVVRACMARAQRDAYACAPQIAAALRAAGVRAVDGTAFAVSHIRAAACRGALNLEN